MWLAWRRRVIETRRPPNYAFHLRNVAERKWRFGQT